MPHLARWAPMIRSSAISLREACAKLSAVNVSRGKRVIHAAVTIAASDKQSSPKLSLDSWEVSDDDKSVFH
ncbi:hypothetical protein ISN76_14280 [Dyella halodurans]|uniref:Uncharacterized protein n=1 Tax=Dyella halodurans TaxID=1920171 RepID=A0ABV9C5B3_9GAMM|nr:hypothetical protein [Dyella halodurans]